MPEDAHYRGYVYDSFSTKMSFLQQNMASMSNEALSRELNNGKPLEDLLLQAKAEISLCKKMREWKPWQV